MRISRLAIMASVSAGMLMAFPALTNLAWAVQDQPVTINGVESVCTGVGSAKDNPAWSGYPVKLTFSNLAGENEAAEHVAVMQGGKTVMETDCDAPWLLIKAPAGHYDVHASLPGSTRTASASFSTCSACSFVRLDFSGAAFGSSSPRRYNWRQANTWLALTSWRRATVETEAPLTCVSSTIRRFSSRVCCRRGPVRRPSLSVTKGSSAEVDTWLLRGHVDVPAGTSSAHQTPSGYAARIRRLRCVCGTLLRSAYSQGVDGITGIKTKSGDILGSMIES